MNTHENNQSDPNSNIPSVRMMVDPATAIAAATAGIELAGALWDLVGALLPRPSSCTFMIHNFTNHDILMQDDQTKFYSTHYKDAIIPSGKTGLALLSGPSVDEGHWLTAFSINGFSEWVWLRFYYYNDPTEKGLNGWYLEEGEGGGREKLGGKTLFQTSRVGGQEFTVAVWGYPYMPSKINIYIYESRQ